LVLVKVEVEVDARVERVERSGNERRDDSWMTVRALRGCEGQTCARGEEERERERE